MGDPNQADPDIAAAAVLLDQLAHVIVDRIEATEPLVIDTPTKDYLARLAIHVVRQVDGIARLLMFPYYSEQAGQLVRGLGEATRIAMWLDEPDDPEEQDRRARIYFKDGVVQMKKKVDYYETRSDEPYREDQTDLLAERLGQIEQLEAEAGETYPPLPDAKTMLEGMDRNDLYSLFRWESDPSHASSIAMGQTVAYEAKGHRHLGGRNHPWTRVKRIGATLLLLQYAGHAIFSALGFDTEEWDAAAREAEEKIEALCNPYYEHGAPK